jgi:hypothetical protein
MKKFLVILSAMLVILGVSGISGAEPFTDVKNYNGTLTGGISYDWTFDLNNDIFAIGDINAGDIINEGTFTITTKINDYNVDWIGHWLQNAEIIPDSTALDVIGLGHVFILASIFSEHDLGITITPESNLYLNSLSLSGDYTPAPEPATLLLLGSSLIGLGSLRKRFLKK